MAHPEKTYVATIEFLDGEGRGIAFSERRELAVPFSIPGETWGLSPKPRLIQASPDRVVPPCPYFTRCGGCQLQHMEVRRQGEEKQRWLRSLLRDTAADAKILPLIPSPKAWNYRRRIQLHVGPKSEVGFYAWKSRQVVDIEGCRIADEALNAVIPEVRQRAQEILRGPRKPASLTFELTLLDGGAIEIVRDGEARSFLQVNPEANRELVRVLALALDKLRPRRVLELFAGDGNFTHSLASPGQFWLAVESDPRAVERGKAVPPRAGMQVQWKAGEAAKVGAQLFQARERFDLVLLDPPRGGAEDCLPVFRKWKPPALLYVSCHAPILKKDLQVLVKAGYGVEWVQPIDFFPQTMNLETVVFLRRS